MTFSATNNNLPSGERKRAIRADSIIETQLSEILVGIETLAEVCPKQNEQ